MHIEQAVGYLGPLCQGPPNGCWNRLTSLAAESRQIVELDADAAHAAHFIEAWRELYSDTELLVDPLLHAVQVFQAGYALQPSQKAVFLVPSQAKDAQIAAGFFQQLIAPAGASGGRAGLTDRNRSCHASIIAKVAGCCPSGR